MEEALVTPESVFAVVYQELRRIARRQRRAAPNATLDTTALVHEVYVKLHAAPAPLPLDRNHFVSLATRAMRQVLVNHARARTRLKRCASGRITGLEDDGSGAGSVVDLVALDCALERLAQLDPPAAHVIEWRIFAGLEMSEIAELQGSTERTVFRHWRRARAFLVNELELASPAAEL